MAQRIGAGDKVQWSNPDGSVILGEAVSATPGDNEVLVAVGTDANEIRHLVLAPLSRLTVVGQAEHEHEDDKPSDKPLTAATLTSAAPAVIVTDPPPAAAAPTDTPTPPTDTTPTQS